MYDVPDPVDTGRRRVNQIRVSSFVVSMRDEEMIGVIVWLDALLGKPDESNT